MRYSIVFCALFGWLSLGAQNLVQNGGLEDWDASVSTQNEDQFVDHALGWHSLLNSPDVFCPENGLGSASNAHTGTALGRFVAVHTGSQSEFAYTTTDPLTAGATYEVSYWVRKEFGDDPISTVGISISPNLPNIQLSPYSTNVAPLVTTKPTGGWQQVRACFTASTSGIHYIAVGPFDQIIPDPVYNSGYLFDDVSVTLLDATTAYPTAEITMTQSSFCVGDQVLLDATGCTNQTEYSWEIIDETWNNNSMYNSGLQSGNPGVFDFSTAVSIPQPGHCYKAILHVYGTCSASEEVEFCFENPTVSFITDGNPVCEGVPTDLTVTGDDGWTYTWSLGSAQLSSGTGLKTITVTPEVGNSVYTVTVTTPEGCVGHQSISLNVSSQNNEAPTMNGINGTGEYTYYVQQGNAVNFNSTLSNDHNNEQMVITFLTNTTGYSTTLPPASGGSMIFVWQTTLGTATGEYYFTLTADDRNACDPKIGVFTFKIIVVCDQCPICVSYENRIPGGTPLPSETAAGRCIQAGLSQTVSTGDASIVFRAGEYIEVGNFFDAGPGYEAIIEPTCITDCEDCCVNWAGFTNDPLPDYFYMNFEDSDPTNDFIQITDTYHPFCAYNAFGYEFRIFDEEGHQLNSIFGEQFSNCCSFDSPAPENPIAHASIWWDGYYVNIWGNTVHASDGVYFYTLILKGCSGDTAQYQGNIYVFSNSGMVEAPDSMNLAGLGGVGLAGMQTAYDQTQILEQSVEIRPNPTSNIVVITGTDRENTYYQIFDERGNLLSHKEKAVNQTADFSGYSAGTYYLRVYSGSTYVTRKVIKI